MQLKKIKLEKIVFYKKDAIIKILTKFKNLQKQRYNNLIKFK